MSVLAKIYEIRCLVTGRVYIGSTTQYYLSRRVSVHRFYQKAGICSSSLAMEHNSYKYKVIEQVPLEDRYDRERFFILNTPNCVNKLVPRAKDFDHAQYNRDCVSRHYYAYQEKIKERNRNYYHEVVKPRRSAAGGQPSSCPLVGATAFGGSSGAQPSCSCSGVGAQPSSSGAQPSCSCSGPQPSRSRRRSAGKIAQGVSLEVALAAVTVQEDLPDSVPC